MTPQQLKTIQAPLKDRYRQDPASAVVKLHSQGELQIDALTCRVQTVRGPVDAGLHSAAGGDGSGACSGDMLLDALVACAGVTLSAVATALDVPIRGGRITAEGDMDFRGTLGVSKEAPVGLTRIHLQFELDTDATAEQLDKLIKLTERYCVIFQTLQAPAAVSTAITRRGGKSNA